MAETESDIRSVISAFLEAHGEDLALVRQNNLLDEWSFLRFSRDRGIRVSGTTKGDPGLFHRLGWLPGDGQTGEGLPLFHPFRIYPLFWILEACRLRVAASASVDRGRFLPFLLEVAEKTLPSLEAIGERASTANELIQVPILLEPVYWPRITGRTAYGAFFEEGEFEARLWSYADYARDLVAQLNPHRWEKNHEQLRHHAAALDENHSLYLLLRLAPWARRERLKGRLSCALWIRHIAEVLRRAFEEVHGVQWLEEDNGFGQWPEGARLRLYGSERPLESPTASRPYLAFEYGLHTGSVVRWYVEGETEFGAISEILPNAALGGIELINLRGSLEKKSGVAMKLSDHLKQDLALRRFSIISFDTDEPNTLRFVRQQIRQRRVVGFVTANAPDFELANFSLPELVEIAARLDEENGCSGDVLRKGDWAGVTSSSEFEARYRRISLGSSKLKGDAWGAALAGFAVENPIGPTGDRRPFLNAIEMALRSRIVQYDFHRARYEVNPDTFESVRIEGDGGVWD